MWDKRVIRGNTYASMVLPVNMQNDLLEQEKKARKQEEVNRLRDIKEQKDVED